jgi:hypothetical protein
MRSSGSLSHPHSIDNARPSTSEITGRKLCNQVCSASQGYMESRIGISTWRREPGPSSHRPQNVGIFVGMRISHISAQCWDRGCDAERLTPLSFQSTWPPTDVLAAHCLSCIPASRKKPLPGGGAVAIESDILSATAPVDLAEIGFKPSVQVLDALVIFAERRIALAEFADQLLLVDLGQRAAVDNDLAVDQNLVDRGTIFAIDEVILKVVLRREVDRFKIE